MRRLRVLVIGAAAAGCLVGAMSCSGVQADVGTDAFLQVPGAQFVRGPMPDGSDAGPSVAQANLISNNIWAGLADDPLTGALDPSATAVAIGLQGDQGYWIVGAGVPGVSTPNDPSFAANLVFSLGIVPGGYTLEERAVDNGGNFGLPSTQTLLAVPSPTNPPAVGALVVTLTWDTESNLSLHVLDPTGTEIYWGNQSSQPPFAFNQVDGGSYGYIDYASNANCVIDGLRREDAIWPNAPPPGQYVVRVDAPSLCGQPIANWKVVVVLDGNPVGEATGVAVGVDTMGTHGLGAGVLALQFTVPG